MTRADVLIDQLSLKLPGVKSTEGQRLAELVIEKLKNKCPRIDHSKKIDNLDIAVNIPAGVPDYMYAEIIAERIIEKIK